MLKRLYLDFHSSSTIDQGRFDGLDVFPWLNESVVKFELKKMSSLWTRLSFVDGI